jgi:hypothetical protein
MIGAQYHPIDAQAPPSRWRPQWRVGHLVYQGGNPLLKRSSLTGSGFIPMRSLAGREQPMWQPYVTPVSSQVGAGFAPARPNFLSRLAGGVKAAFQ